MSEKLRYGDFADRIDLERLYSAIGFEPFSEQRGNDVGHCIWPENHAHGDSTGKFAIHREDKVYNCYVCGGGSLLSLAMQANDMNVDDATHWLYQFAKPPADDEQFLEEFERDLEDVEQRTRTLPYFNEHVLDKWVQNVDQDVLDFLKEKWAISAEVAREYRIGFNADHRRRARDEVYIGPALIFPVTWKGRLIGWQERWLEPDDNRPQWVPKYTNTTDLPRKEIIFNYDAALGWKQPGPHEQRGLIGRLPRQVFVVESVASVYALRSLRLNVVGTFGSSASDAQKRLLRRFSQGVILCPDNDKPKDPKKKPAGLKWRDDLSDYLKRFVPVGLLPPPPVGPKEDVADLLAKSDLRAFDAWVCQAQDPLEVELANA